MNDPTISVLVIEDLDWPGIMLERELGDKINFQMVDNIESAQRVVSEEPLPDLVIINGRVNAPISESMKFVQILKGRHPGLILIGASNESRYQEKLVEAGCDYATDHISLVPALEHFLEL